MHGTAGGSRPQLIAQSGEEPWFCLDTFMALIDLKFAQITLSDGSTNSLVVNIGTGNLEYTEKRNVDLVKRRGELDTAREGDEEAIDVSFQFIWDTLTASNDEDPPTVEDVLKHRGNAADWVSVAADPDAPFAVDIAIVYTPPCSQAAFTIFLNEFYYAELAHSLEDATIDCKGVCNRTEAVQV